MISMKLFNKKIKSNVIQKKKYDTELKLRTFAFMPLEDVYLQLNASQKGLTSAEAESRRDEFGENIITAGKKIRWLTG